MTKEKKLEDFLPNKNGSYYKKFDLKTNYFNKKEDIEKQLSRFNADITAGQITWRSIADEMLDKSLAITRKMNHEVELTR